MDVWVFVLNPFAPGDFEASRVVFWSLSCYKELKPTKKSVYRWYTSWPSDPHAKYQFAKFRHAQKAKFRDLGFKSDTAVLTFTFRFLSSLLFSLFLPHFFFSCWAFSRLHLVGKVFRKAFRILGLDERKSGWVVEQDFHRTFQVNVIWLQCYNGLLTA